jgi:HEAT repeat protein
VPTRDEIEAGLLGAFDLVCELTPQGGARWEAVVNADWSLFLSQSETLCFRESEAQSRGYLEYAIEVDRARGRTKGAVRWKELRPWRPVYWKVLPRGYQVQSRLPKESSDELDCSWPFPYAPWSLEFTPTYHRAPKDLVHRKERRPASDSAGEMTSWPTGKLWKEVETGRSQRRRFAAACEYAPRADAEGIRHLLHFRYGEIRFAGIRELARRREKAGVPELIAIVLRQQYPPALWAIGEIGDERALPVLEMLFEYGMAADAAQDGAWLGTLLRAMARFGDQQLPFLENALASKEYRLRGSAVATLGLIGSEAARALLERELERAACKGSMRWDIETALGRRKGWRSPEARAEARLWQVASVVSEARNAPPPADPVSALAATLSHPDRARRRAAVDLLVGFDARDRLPDIARLASDPEWEVRASVACSLRRLGGSRRLLGMLAKDQSPTVRWLAKNPVISPGE